MDTVYGDSFPSLTAVKMWTDVFKLVVTGLKKREVGTWRSVCTLKKAMLNIKLWKQF